MDNDNTTPPIVSWAFRNRLRLLIFGGIGIIVLLIILFLVFKSVVFVAVSGSSSSTVFAVTDDSTTQVGSSGLVVVPRGTKSLLVTAGDNVKTQAGISLPWYGFTTRTVQLTPDKNADKVAYLGGDPTCAAYDQAADALLHYVCKKPTQLLQYKTPANNVWGTKKVAGLAYVADQILPPYMNGVIGVSTQAASGGNTTSGAGGHDVDPVSISATSANGRTLYAAPAGINQSSVAGLRIFTDTNDPTDAHFILVDAFGVIYLATPDANSSAIKYKRISAPEDYNYRYNQTLCSINGEGVFCYRGRTGVQAPSGTTLSKPSIVQLSFTDGVTSTKSVSGVSVLDGFYQTGAGQLYGKDGALLYSLTVSSGNYIAHALPFSPQVVVAGDKLYFIKDNGVFALDNTSADAHQIFYSANLLVRSVYPVAGKVFVFAATQNTGTNIYAYRLNNESDTTPGKRPIDVLPLATSAVDGINYDDFVGNTYFVHMNSNAPSYQSVGDSFRSVLASSGITNVPKQNVILVK